MRNGARAAIKIRRYVGRNARLTATITTVGYERRRVYADGMFVLYFCNLPRHTDENDDDDARAVDRLSH